MTFEAERAMHAYRGTGIAGGLNLPTPGEAARLKPMRVPGVVKPKTFTPKLGKPKTPAVPGVALSDQFTLKDPYDPKTISQQALRKPGCEGLVRP